LEVVLGKKANETVEWALVVESVTASRVELHRLHHLITRCLNLVEKSDQKDHLYQVAGDLIQAIPDKISKLEALLDKSAYALSSVGKATLKKTLPLTDRNEVDEVAQTAKPFKSASVKRVVDAYLSRTDD
jgi:hypothetical protein